MKTIIKHGVNPKKIVRNFVCKECGCVFNADFEEYFVSANKNRNTFTFKSVCPECGEMASSYPEVYKR